MTSSGSSNTGVGSSWGSSSHQFSEEVSAEVLSADGHNVTVVDLSAERLRQLGERLDLRTLVGHCTHSDVLIEAGADRCDLLVATTQVDEINMLAASIAKVAGTKKTIVYIGLVVVMATVSGITFGHYFA